MKSRKVLLGLFVGLCVCFCGTIGAQTANYQSNKLVEIGPDNIGGRVTSLVVMGYGQAAYAGAATGGLYKDLPFTNSVVSKWEYMPCFIDGKEVTLPISCMNKLNDSTILIGTGESYYPTANRQKRFTAMGHGLFLFNTNTEVFTPIQNTVPQNNESDFACVNKIEVLNAGGATHVMVATPKGLFRWTLNETSDIMAAPVKVFDGNVLDVVISGQFNRAFFTANARLYKMSDFLGNSQPVDITSSCNAFGISGCDIRLAVAPSDQSYLYAMVTNKSGLLVGIYLTRNTNTWNLISTSTVLPFNSAASAKTCGTMTVHPTDPTKIYVGGADVWTGKGYVEDSPYQWTVSSNNESSLNYGDYMANVYSNASFVHSGIHQIVLDTRTYTAPGDPNPYFIVTDGGIHYSIGEMSSFFVYNLGLNAVQINSLDIMPDGSIISGANSNGCPFIEARMEHHGGSNDPTWFDQSGLNTNHKANILWYGDGGYVAASRFSQYQPLMRRNIFVSGANGVIGRAYSDYSNYTNTQTWTYGSAFMSDLVQSGPAIGKISLWETEGEVAHKDSVSFVIDTLAYIYRNGQQHLLKRNFQVQPGDSIVVLDVAHAGYPFWHVFDHAFTVGEELHQKVASPYASRLLAITQENNMPKNTNVSLCWFPSDFRQVYDGSNPTRFWAHIYAVNSANFPNCYAREAVMSKDGDVALIVVENDSLEQSFIVRVKGFAAVDYSNNTADIRDMLNYKIETRVTTTDTIKLDGENHFFPGRISSIAIDPRTGEDNLIVTFDKTGEGGANVAYIHNVTSANPTISLRTVGTAGAPAYSALIEYTTGAAYVGTEQGVFTASTPTATSWTEYGAFNGVPVTSICQQTANFPVVRYTGHDGVAEESYIFPHTKWPYALYFGTYGRGIFMDSTYVTDHTNEILDPQGVLDIPTVNGDGINSVRFYPNPAVDNATMQLTLATDGQAQLRIYDLSGRLVLDRNLGHMSAGSSERTIDCTGLMPGMYLVNVVVGNTKASSKLIVR